MSVFADGAPMRPHSPRSLSSAQGSGDGTAPPSPPAPSAGRPSAPERASNAVSRLRQFEGSRGYSARMAVYLRHVAYLAAILVCSAVTQFCTEGIPNASNGGMWMLLSVTVMVLGGALGTIFYTNLRNELIEKVRHYVFGIALFPGMLVAIFLRATRDFLGDDAFAGTIAVALPIVFLCTVILPALIFIKELSGIRTLHRSRLDDQEAMALWTRQDGLQR